VEHQKELVSQADHLIELGPGAGIHGGQITYQGDYKNLAGNRATVSGPWLSGDDTLPPPPKRGKSHEVLSVRNATLHNLKNFSVDIPLYRLVGLCGVSGSGKSTLAIDLIASQLKGLPDANPIHINGHQNIQRIVMVGQEPAGISSRSIPATYVDLMGPLRKLFAETKLAKARGYTAARFSLNKKGGRCEACEGMGYHRLNMQFMPDLLVPCDVCRGRRYNYETLQVTWDGYSIADLLEMPVEEAYGLFKNIPPIGDKLQLMRELGLDYLSLGQPFSTLSGGERQRLKLVADLAKRQQGSTLYIIDEPSAGLHFQDVKKLVKILHRLVDAGHSVLLVEHNMDLLKQADWLIELGPEGGPGGGRVIFEGAPAQLARAKTPTARVYH
jgi:excinuclease ABC subunit A